MSRINSWFCNTDRVEDDKRECFHYYMYPSSGEPNGKFWNRFIDNDEGLITVPGTNYKVSFVRDSICDIHGRCVANVCDEIDLEYSMPREYTYSADTGAIYIL